MKMFKCLVVFFLLVTVTTAFAAKNEVTLISSSPDGIVLQFGVTAYDFEKVKTPNGQEKVVVAPNTSWILKAGAPDLKKMSASVIIPDEAQMQVEVLESEFVEIDNIRIAPSKGNLTRNVNPKNIPFEYGPEYQTNAFFPGNLAELRAPYIARDFRGQTVLVNPFQYNPVTEVLRVYTNVKVRISDGGQLAENAYVRDAATKNIDPAFNDVYTRHFINYTPDQTEYTPLGDAIGNMLIVSYGSFMDEMAPFVAWKQSLGYNVSIVDYATIGSSSALKTYVANYYNSNGLTFLLLVGDSSQVATSSTSAGESDNNYGYILGSDSYQEIFVGRFSAETEAEVTTQVDRTINYERDVLSTAAFFNHAIGMGSSEGTGDDGEYDYEHINNILADLAGIGYTTHECHQSGGSPSLMSSYINNGAGAIFYCGHGTVSGWYTTSWQYTSTDVNGLVNEWELPFVISVACVVGDFVGNTCYSEVWQRATNNGNPTGAIANAGATINQSWNPPMCAEDEMADVFVAGSVRTFGGLFVNGMFQMNDEYGSAGDDMTDTWVCFGDSSVQIRSPLAPNGPISGGNIPPSANFSYVTNLLQVTFTDLSTDSDGTIVSWDWDFGDGNTSTAQNPVHTFAANGTYQVTLTVTDDEGATGIKTQDVYVNDGTAPEIFVDNIAMSTRRAGNRYSATAVVTIKDTDGYVVPNATVSVTWSGSASGTDSGVTDASGNVSFSTAYIRFATSFTITVNNVTHATLQYNSALNNETSDTINP
jgi:PKD repeat protein